METSFLTAVEARPRGWQGPPLSRGFRGGWSDLSLASGDFWQFSVSPGFSLRFCGYSATPSGSLPLSSSPLLGKGSRIGARELYSMLLTLPKQSSEDPVFKQGPTTRLGTGT